MVKTIIFTKTEQRIQSALEEVAMLIESINDKQILENEGNIFLPYVDDNTPREELDQYRFFRGKKGGCFYDMDWKENNGKL